MKSTLIMEWEKEKESKKLPNSQSHEWALRAKLAISSFRLQELAFKFNNLLQRKKMKCITC